MVVFGTRPEAIKMCPVIKEMKKYKEIEVIVCVTGQHKEMLTSVLDIFHVKPKYDLEIMRERQTLFDITGDVLFGIILLNVKCQIPFWYMEIQHLLLQQLWLAII